MSGVDHFDIKKVFLLGLNAEQDSRSEMLVKLCEDAGNKKAVVLREKQGERSETTEKNPAQLWWTEKVMKTLRTQGFKEEEALKCTAEASGPKAFDLL